MRVAAIALVVFAACNLGDSVRLDGGAVVDGDVDVGADALGDGEAGPASDAGGLSGRGPVTHVVSDIALTTERRCDLDGDGFDDNAIADLGEPSATLFANMVGIGLFGEYETGGRYLLHFPSVEDRSLPADPSTMVFFLGSVDLDVPESPADDLSGSEPLWVSAPSLDGCGEPLDPFAGVTIVDGHLSASIPTVIHTSLAAAEPEGEGLKVRGTTMTGRVTPGFQEGEWELCGYGTIADLGAAPYPNPTAGLSVLEVITVGGRPFGVPTLPGLTPDVDVDGDGLERFSVDGDGRIVACIDGDSTEIPGRDCWQDPRMADGVSMNFHLQSTTAECVGPEPGWRAILGETCEEPPREGSLWNGSCGCEGRFSAGSRQLFEALSAAETVGTETGEAIPLLDSSLADVGIYRGTVALAEATTETLEWAGDPARCVVLRFDINAEGDETPFEEEGEDWIEAGLIIRGADTGATGGVYWVRAEPTTTFGDLNLIDTRDGNFQLDYGGPLDDDIEPSLRPAVERAKEIVLETIAGCRSMEE